MEEWRSIPGYEGFYEVSNLGRVKSLARKVIRKGGRILPVKEKIRKLATTEDGYKRIDLYNEFQKGKCINVHRLVAFAFIPNPKNKPQINHLNAIRDDNRVENLEWCTSKENLQYAYDNGFAIGRKGQDNSRAKLTEKEVLEIRKIYKPYSPQCNARLLSRKYKVNYQTIRFIIARKRWKHI